MRQKMGVGLLRPVVRQLSSQRVSGGGRILQTAFCRGRDYLRKIQCCYHCDEF